MSYNLIVVFREIEHTADRAIEIEAETLEGLFQEAVAALSTLYSGEEPVKLHPHLLLPPRRGRIKVRGKGNSYAVKISVRADDLEGLLVGFLNEVIFHTERKRVLFTSAGVKIKEKAGAGYSLTAELFNGKITPLSEVKSATYHNLKVEKRDGKWHTMIVFDV